MWDFEGFLSDAGMQKFCACFITLLLAKVMPTFLVKGSDFLFMLLFKTAYLELGLVNVICSTRHSDLCVCNIISLVTKAQCFLQSDRYQQYYCEYQHTVQGTLAHRLQNIKWPPVGPKFSVGVRKGVNNCVFWRSSHS